MYKQSNYNINVNTLENGKILFFNTVSNAFGIMDAATQQLYENIDTIIIEDLTDIEEKNNINTLLNYGYIVPQEINELDVLKLKSQMNKYFGTKLILTIAPTLDCNMACPYCFEKKQKIRMSEEVQQSLYNFAEKYLEKRASKEFHVTWYGGEPLLEVDIICKLSEKFIKLCDDKSIKYSASIITNGSLLGREVATQLKEKCRVSAAQITIDGLPEYHNNRRILIDGRDSFEIIINNIERCKDLFKISIRVNVDKNNMNNIQQLCDFFIKEKGWHNNPEFYIAPVISYENNCNYKNCITGSEYGQIDLQVISQLNGIEHETIKKLFYPGLKSLACTAVQYGAYVVDPDGDLYSCFNVIGDKEKKIGDVNHMWALNSEYIKWLLHEPTGECLTCNLLPMCAGGCPYEFFLKGKPTCDKKIFNFKDRLMLAYQDYIEQPVSVYCKK